MRWSALAPGKRLRPALVMASCEALGCDPTHSLDVACAVEMVHCFSLIHDDLPAIDDDDLRRGRPTCHVKFGEALAILAGDALFALAFRVAANMKASAEARADAVSVLAGAAGTPGLVAGEVLDILAEGTEPNLEAVQQIHAWKTGSLISASCVLGGIIAGADAEQRQHLSEAGRWAGQAFQIADDVLNETSTADHLGKAVGSDREKSKQTYPALMGLEAAKAAGEECVERAVEHVQRLPGPKEALQSLIRYSVDRTL